MTSENGLFIPAANLLTLGVSVIGALMVWSIKRPFEDLRKGQDDNRTALAAFQAEHKASIREVKAEIKERAGEDAELRSICQRDNAATYMQKAAFDPFSKIIDGHGRRIEALESGQTRLTGSVERMRGEVDGSTKAVAAALNACVRGSE